MVNNTRLAHTMIFASAGPRTRRLVIAAPMVLLTLSAPAATRPALPLRDLLPAGDGMASSLGRILCFSFSTDLRGVREVFQIHLLHRLRKRFVLDRHVQLPVTDPTRHIEIA